MFHCEIPTDKCANYADDCCDDRHSSSFTFCGLVGRAAAARVLKGFTREGCRRLRSTQAGLTVLNPSPLKVRKRGGCLVVALTRPGGLGGSRTRAPRFRCRAKRQKGANQLSRPCICFRASRSHAPDCVYRAVPSSRPDHGGALGCGPLAGEQVSLALFPMKFFK